MSPTITTFADILNAMSQNPELREAMRRHILTDELLQLPAIVAQLVQSVQELNAAVAVINQRLDRLESGQAELKSDVAELKNGQAELRSDVAELKNGQAELRSDVAELKNGQAELRSDVAELKSNQAELKSNQTRMQGQLNNLTGSDYERKIARRARRIARSQLNMPGAYPIYSPTMPDATALSELLENAAALNHITDQQADEAELTDLVIRSAAEPGPARYALAEISLTIHHEDVNRARRRADILAAATGSPVAAAAIGTAAADASREYAAAHDVTVIIVPND